MARDRNDEGMRPDRVFQSGFLGENARRLYNIEAPKTFIRERVTEIERPAWWPTESEIEKALEPEAALYRRRTRA